MYFHVAVRGLTFRISPTEETRRVLFSSDVRSDQSFPLFIHKSSRSGTSVRGSYLVLELYTKRSRCQQVGRQRGSLCNAPATIHPTTRLQLFTYLVSTHHSNALTRPSPPPPIGNQESPRRDIRSPFSDPVPPRVTRITACFSAPY